MRLPSSLPSPRRICFVTGTRAEFGLMRSGLEAIAADASLQLQLVVTGMHLDRSRGRSLDVIRRDGWNIDAVIPWVCRSGAETENAAATGRAIAAMAKTFDTLDTHIVLVTGDRVEAFAAATAGHLGGRLVAHVHGGDRALGLVDDSLRHAITKLAHIHFPATQLSAARLVRMGEDRWRIFRTGSPGLDDVKTAAAPRSVLMREFPGLEPRRYAIVLLHPQSPISSQERRAGALVIRAVQSAGIERMVIIYPNNDPGSAGIAACWDALPRDARLIVRRDIPRPLFLGLLRDAAVLAGNSSSGIIEAASFGTPVLDIGDRQLGRERGRNVAHAALQSGAISRQLRRIWNGGRPLRFPQKNLYGGGGAGMRIAAALARIPILRFRRKLIAF